jgi:DNA-directed RNA polymerase subunit M/transcription elongation factor TFIIS
MLNTDVKLATVSTDPRSLMGRMFVDVLHSAHQHYRDNKQICERDAKRIETSCYNATIKASIDCGIFRNWNDPTFKDIYSTRCGSILGLLDVESISCMEYGNTTVEKLVSGEISTQNIGMMSVVEICPQSRDKENHEIMMRSEQRVAIKESNLFQCPHCRQRRCIYTQKQTRQLDEEADYFCFCLECNKRFKGR